MGVVGREQWRQSTNHLLDSDSDMFALGVHRGGFHPIWEVGLDKSSLGALASSWGEWEQVTL